MTTKNNSKVRELRAFLLTTEFKKAMEDLVDDPAFTRTVKYRTDSFIRRHGKTPVEALPCIEADPKHQQQQSTQVALEEEQEIDISPPPVPSTPKIPGWLSSFDNTIVPNSRQTIGAMAANRAKASSAEVTRQLEFSQDDCNFWIEIRRRSGQTRVVLCSEDKGRLSLVQAITFGSDVADIEHIGNDAVIKIDPIVLDFYIHRFESNKGIVPCPTLIFSRNG